MPKGVYERIEYHRSIISNALIGRKRSEKERQSISESRIGIKFSNSHCQNISKARMGMKFSDEHKQNLSKALGDREFSTEWKQRISQGLKQHFIENPKARQNISKVVKKRFANMTKEERRENPWILAGQRASQFANPSSIERKIWRELNELEIEYETQIPLNHGKFIIDIYVSKWKLIIECNGDYFHDYKKFPKQKIRDNALEKYINKNGYKIVWLWEHDVIKNQRLALLDGLKEFLKF